MKCRDRVASWGWVVCLAVGPAGADGVEPAPPPEPNPLVERVLSDPLTESDDLKRLSVFHGRLDAIDGTLDPDTEPALAAEAALAAWRLDDPLLGGTPRVPAELLAEAALRQGRPEAALAGLADAVVDLDTATRDDLHARLLLARAHDELNDIPAAVAALEPIRGLLIREQLTDAADLTRAAEAILTLARLQGRPGDDYQLALDLLRRAREADPLDWRPRLVEGRLLAEKDNRGDGAEALAEVLSLNPAQADAWYELGKLNVESFNFDGAASIIARLNAMTPDHPLAAILEARSLIHQKDPRPLLEPDSSLNALLDRYPTHREALALKAAAAAIAYDDDIMSAALAELDRLSPGTPLGHHEVGLAYSHARQYPQAEHHLRQAISRQPNDANPRVALGLLLMQAGTLDQAHAELALAASLDPFNRYAGNSLALVEELLGWETIETDHFVIRYRDGIDAALAADMPDILESLYDDITAQFAHEPETKTQIDLMPDEQYFGVRIAGLPEIWTIAAATGPVIAMTPPRDGPRQRGTFDVANVLRHEFVHTVNLSQTKNRIPHWFTEACAVSNELTGRTFANQRLLAAALDQDELFDLDEINWAFVRPEKPTDRPLAYAQSAWMLEYIELRYGWEAVLDMLARYREGEGDAQTLEAVTQLTVDEFMSDFKAWAYEQVAVWGLDAGSEPALAPGNPARLRAIVPAALEAGNVPAAMAALETLDAAEGITGAYAHQLAELHRDRGDLAPATYYADRALHREPYNAEYRTTAATLSLQAGRVDDTLRHLAALTVLEPTQAIHHVRLAAMRHRTGDLHGADAAARAARDINPDAPVDTFLKPD